MALLDTIESILESLRGSLPSTTDENGKAGAEGLTSYRGAISAYRTELLNHIAEQKKSVTDALPLAAATDVTSIRKKMDSLNTKVNRLKKELKDLDS